MTDKTTEALKLAEEALETDVQWGFVNKTVLTRRLTALAAIREALAEPVCKRCNGTKLVYDGEIDNIGGVDLEVPIECVKDCPDCAEPANTRSTSEYSEPVKQEPVAWVDASEQMPNPSKAVLIHYVINSPAYGGTRSGVIRAQWIPAKTEESNDDDHFEYDEETDTYYVPEGWYELVDNWDEYSSVHVCEGDITHWMPLPEFPNAAQVSAKREWVELTDDELKAALEVHQVGLSIRIGRIAIAAFKEKNK